MPQVEEIILNQNVEDFVEAFVKIAKEKMAKSNVPSCSYRVDILERLLEKGRVKYIEMIDATRSRYDGFVDIPRFDESWRIAVGFNEMDKNLSALNKERESYLRKKMCEYERRIKAVEAVVDIHDFLRNVSSYQLTSALLEEGSVRLSDIFLKIERELRLGLNMCFTVDREQLKRNFAASAVLIGLYNKG